MRARRQRLHQRKRADVRVGAENAIANGGERLAGIHVAQFVALGQELVDAPEDVVAHHHRDFEPRREPHHFARAGHRIHPAGVGDHRDAALADLRRRAARRAAENRARSPGSGRPAAAFAESTW